MFTESYNVSHRSLTEFVAVVVEGFSSSVAVQHPTHLYSRRDGKVTIRARDAHNTVTVDARSANVRGFKKDGGVVVLQSNGPQSAMHDQAILGLVDSRVIAAAAWLDANRPGWESRVNLDVLHMFSPTRCILGQVFADKVTGANNGFLWAVDNLPGQSDHAYAFAARQVESDWRLIIRSRRA